MGETAQATDIVVPKLNNNDATYTLVEWLVADGQPVAGDDAVATVETSKASEDLVCADEGVLRQLVSTGSECAPGAVIGRVVAAGTPDTRPADHTAAPANGGTPDVVVTAPAQALIDELGIAPERVLGLGMAVVRRADVERLAAPATPTERSAGTETMPAGQRAVARTVTHSHQHIPAAYTVLRVDVTAALDLARDRGREWGKLVGLPELLVAAVAGLHESFPRCFGRPVDEQTLRLPVDGCAVGVTIDVGTGLYVPVVRDAARVGLANIAATMTEFRMAAIRGSFREQDFADACIGVTLHHDPDVVAAVPFVFPGQTCALALTGAREELFREPTGEIGSRTVANVGLAYDHRFVNGYGAIQFLRAVKESLERPDTIA